MLLLYLYVTSSCRPFKSFLLEENDIHYLGYKKNNSISRKMFFFVLSRAWDEEKILSPHEESNL